jgi:cobalt/nickel transport system permease protein
LAGFLSAIAVASVLVTVPAAAAAMAGAGVLVLVGRVPLRWYMRRLSALLPFFLLFGLFLPVLVRDPDPWLTLGPLTISEHGIRLAALICLKGLAIVTLVLVLLTAAPFHVTLQAAHSLRVPGLLVQLTLLTYRYIFLLASELARLRVALRVRGYRSRAALRNYRTVAHAAGALLVRSHDRAERVAQAMRCRGFDGRFRSLTEFRTTPADVLLFAAFVMTSAAIIALDLVLR